MNRIIVSLVSEKYNNFTLIIIIVMSSNQFTRDD